MSGMPDSLKDLALDLLASRALPDLRERLSALSGEEWAMLQELARQQRIAPLLHWRLEQGGLADCPPAEFKDWLRIQRKRSTLRALALRRELLSIATTLHGQGIPCVGLKGAWLAFHAYPQPGLRTMRDIDLLAPHDRASEAYQALKTLGYAFEKAIAESAATHNHDFRHLPPLVLADRHIAVELHTLLFHPETLESHPDPALNRAFWDHLRHQPDEPQPLAYLNAELQLLHIIVHAVYDHMFSNGPLSFLDIALSLSTLPPDWDAFWHLARKYDWERGCQLMFRITEHYHGPLPTSLTLRPEWQAVMAIPAGFAVDCARQSLQPPERRHEEKMQIAVSQSTGLSQQLQLICFRLLPSPRAMMRRYPVRGAWQLPGWYLLHWRNMILNRMPDYLKALRHTSTAETGRTMALKRWLLKQD